MCQLKEMWSEGARFKLSRVLVEQVYRNRRLTERFGAEALPRMRSYGANCYRYR